jgi:hypothetical protein
MFEFHAGYVYADDTTRRLSFADRNDDTGRHYFVMDRSEESPEECVADMGNVYIERDDQGWGGYGGIDLVILNRESLTLELGPRMATRMGGHETLRVTFRIKDAQFRELRQVLGFIMLGYESQLEVHADRSESNEESVVFSVYETPTAGGSG